jgi:hypothetical protein
MVAGTSSGIFSDMRRKMSNGFAFFGKEGLGGRQSNQDGPESAYLTFRDITWKTDEGQLILEGITGLFAPGEVTAIMGPSVKSIKCSSI